MKNVLRTARVYYFPISWQKPQTPHILLTSFLLWVNGYHERFNGTLQHEVLDREVLN